MKKSQQFPVRSDDLIAWLDVTYPERCADPADAEREIWMKAGERRLINKLLLREQAHKEKMTPNVSRKDPQDHSPSDSGSGGEKDQLLHKRLLRKSLLRFKPK